MDCQKERRERGRKKVNEMMVEKFQNLMKNINLHTEEQ